MISTEIEHNIQVFNKLFHKLWKTCGKSAEKSWETLNSPQDCLEKRGNLLKITGFFPFYDIFDWDISKKISTAYFFGRPLEKFSKGCC